MGESVRTQEVEDRIIEGLESGVTLSERCREIGISRVTVWNWQKADPEFAERIARAREVGFDVIAERTRETARGIGDSTRDVVRDKLIIETDLKLLAKWDPKRYGDRTVLAGDADAPLLGGLAESILAARERAKERGK